MAPHQYRRLKKIRRCKKLVEPDIHVDWDLYQYLMDEEYVSRDCMNHTATYTIRERGEAALHEYFMDHIKTWVPITVSLFALLVSALTYFAS